MEQDQDTGLIALGIVLRPVGLDGRCRVQPHGNSLKTMKTPCMVYLGQTGAHPVPASLRKVSVTPRGYDCLFDGCSSMDDAERIRGATIYGEQERLPPLPTGRYYRYQLDGLKVILSPSGLEWGIVADLHNFPAADALEVHTAQGAVLMVPMTPDVILSVDLTAGLITINSGALEELL